MGSRLNASSTVGSSSVFDFTLKFCKLPVGQAPHTLSNESETVDDELKERKAFNILYV